MPFCDRDRPIFQNYSISFPALLCLNLNPKQVPIEMAPNKKGLSLEDKRKRMMEIFYETKDVFLLKDMEKIAPKSKGITPMSVKDVLTSLVDDGLVDTDKIGTSVYFWAFPSKASQARKRKLETAEESLLKVKYLFGDHNKIMFYFYLAQV